MMPAVVLSGCGNRTSITKSAVLMDTVVSVTIYDADREELLDECLKRCGEYEHLFSSQIEDSEISNINQSGGDVVALSEEMAFLLEKAETYYSLSGGLFDVSVGQITALWDFHGSSPVIPSKQQLEWACRHVGMEYVDIAGDTLTLLDDQVQLDVGGIAKGYIADLLCEYLVSQGIDSGILNLGGNVRVIGSKPDGDLFSVGLQKPFDAEGEVAASLKISDCSVVTAGTYQRYLEVDGVRYHHILNPRTGYPADTDLDSATVICEDAVDADALSTICMLLGQKRAEELIASLDGTEAVFISRDGEISVTDGLILGADGAWRLAEDETARGSFGRIFCLEEYGDGG